MYSKYVVYADWIVNGILRETYEFVKRLSNYKWEVIALSKVIPDFFKDKKCIILFVTYIDTDISIFKTDNNVLIYKIDDLFPFFENSKKCVEACDYIIGTYTHLFTKISNISLNQKPNILIPYSAVPEYYKNIVFNNNPKKKIFVSGAISFHYPLRIFIHNNPLFVNKIESLEHPGYIQNGPLKHDTLCDKYYIKLNEFICCFCDSLLYGYVLAKVFEITSVGSLLLVEDKIENQLNELGFYDNINCIMCNEANLYEKVNYILDDINREKIDSIRINGMELTRSKHTTDNRITTFNNFINNTFN